jgi:mannose/fructose/N-acetylgalactosamine-specific phosphotransferase system component IIC
MLIKSVIVALVGGIICLDRILFQAMISRPVVAGPFIGIILGDPYTGLMVGAFIELLWIDRFPIGVYVPPNDSVVAILVTAGSILAGRELGHVSRELMALSMLLFIPFGIVGQKIDTRIMKSNDVLSCKASENASAGNIKGVAQKHTLALLKSLFSAVALILISLILGIQVLQLIFPLIPENTLKALSLIYFFVPIIGVAVALNTIKLRGIIPIFSGIFLMVALFVEII